MLRLAGVELYFDDVERAKQFYRDVVGLKLLDEQSEHYARFDGGPAFVCVERKNSESYASKDKAVLFFYVSDLQEAVEKIGRKRFAQIQEQPPEGQPRWGVFHDTEGHNVLLIEKASKK
jgi:predicted enzyme related to lactoylglutathione lyase